MTIYERHTTAASLDGEPLFVSLPAPAKGELMRLSVQRVSGGDSFTVQAFSRDVSQVAEEVSESGSISDSVYDGENDVLHPAVYAITDAIASDGDGLAAESKLFASYENKDASPGRQTATRIHLKILGGIAAYHIGYAIRQ